MHHPLVDLDGPVLAPGRVVQRPTHRRVGDDVGAAVEHKEGEGHLREAGSQVVGGPQQLHHGAQPRLPRVAQWVARGHLPLRLDLYRLVDEVGRGDDGQRGRQPGNEGQDLRNGPPGADAVGDLAHGGDEDGAAPASLGAAVAEVDQEAEGAAHGLAVEEAGEAAELRGAADGVEVGEAVVGDGGEVGEEGAEAGGTAVAGEVEGAAGEAVAGEEDGGGLEGPADVVAVAVDHADEGARGRRRGQPGPGEKGEAPGRGEQGCRAADALRGVVLLLVRGVVPPEVALLLLLVADRLHPELIKSDDAPVRGFGVSRLTDKSD